MRRASAIKHMCHCNKCGAVHPQFWPWGVQVPRKRTLRLPDLHLPHLRALGELQFALREVEGEKQQGPQATPAPSRDVHPPPQPTETHKASGWRCAWLVFRTLQRSVTDATLPAPHARTLAALASLQTPLSYGSCHQSRRAGICGPADARAGGQRPRHISACSTSARGRVQRRAVRVL